VNSSFWRYFLSRLLKLIKLVVRRVYNILNAWDKSLEVGFDESAHNFLVRRAAASYDMMDASDEAYYSRHYGDFIEEQLRLYAPISRKLTLDLACGQGRIISELIGRELNLKDVIGVDFSDEVLEKARINLQNLGGDVRINFESSDILEYIKKVQDGSVDILLLLEVLYMLPKPELVLSEISKKLSPRGIAFFSVRTDHYYGLSLLKQGLLEKLDAFKSTNEGEIFDSGVQFNWTDSTKILNEFSSAYGLQIKHLTSIGICSGIPGDPFEHIVRPSEISASDQDSLLELEKFFGKKYPDNGRYLLFSAVKEPR